MAKGWKGVPESLKSHVLTPGNHEHTDPTRLRV